MAKPTKPVAPAAPAAPAAPGANYRAALNGIADAAATAGISREVLVDRIKAFATNPDARTLRDMRDAVMQGYVAGRIARDAGRGAATPEDHAAAIVILAKAGMGAEKPNASGRRTETEERYCNGGRGMWHSLSVSAGAAPESATGTGRSAGGKASAEKRAARTTAGKNAGTANVTAAAPAKAAGAKTTPQLTPATIGMKSRQEAVAGAMHIASHLMAFADKNAKMLGADYTKKIKAAARLVVSLPMPKD